MSTPIPQSMEITYVMSDGSRHTTTTTMTHPDMDQTLQAIVDQTINPLAPVGAGELEGDATALLNLDLDMARLLAATNYRMVHLFATVASTGYLTDLTDRLKNRIMADYLGDFYPGVDPAEARQRFTQLIENLSTNPDPKTAAAELTRLTLACPERIELLMTLSTLLTKTYTRTQRGLSKDIDDIVYQVLESFDCSSDDPFRIKDELVELIETAWATRTPVRTNDDVLGTEAGTVDELMQALARAENQTPPAGS